MKQDGSCYKNKTKTKQKQTTNERKQENKRPKHTSLRKFPPHLAWPWPHSGACSPPLSLLLMLAIQFYYNTLWYTVSPDCLTQHLRENGEQDACKSKALTQRRQAVCLKLLLSKAFYEETAICVYHRASKLLILCKL